mmetsp:Transcript_16225/g.21231  ORF Transcript_16225/g.21231 Transcript_16225/m.21231 type:complete len:177 (-) Transcript_16225:35-565(-)|eukprot:CAMPEP_0198144760 /NCGR_PEP_ID=MMETSP1443-20131203/18375_1 /TAXON_ID=186043 /ORGANISM="Entomoneis sp., Strain CCMP2396" /LENGTH=176 /DNA_ID=CAMNT_0043808219 /DNA_START=250 /DNA_END=780 /DNA_ORIENTATION=-
MNAPKANKANTKSMNQAMVFSTNRQKDHFLCEAGGTTGAKVGAVVDNVGVVGAAVPPGIMVGACVPLAPTAEGAGDSTTADDGVPVGPPEGCTLGVADFVGALEIVGVCDGAGEAVGLLDTVGAPEGCVDGAGVSSALQHDRANASNKTADAREPGLFIFDNDCVRLRGMLVCASR